MTTANNIIEKDPFADREKEKYENPVPSREFILETIKGSNKPLNRNQLIEIFGLHDDQIEGIRRRLKAMERDGQLVWIKGFYHPVDEFEVREGIVSAHPDGFGFVIAEDGKEDIFLSPREMRTLFHGDRVAVRITGVDRRGKRQGIVSEIIEHNTQTITGLFTWVSGYAQVMPDHKKIHQDIVVAAEDVGQAQEGQVVVVEITEYPTQKRKAQGRVIQVLGDHMEPGQEVDVSLRIHDIPHRWPETVLQQLETFADEVGDADRQGYVDLTRIPFVTIDGEDARDFDDAVFCVRTDSGWRLKVAIADVSHYVAYQSELDKEARNRATSVYFPNRVVPMLPEKLSNGLCSLKPDVDRLALVCDIAFDEHGEVLEYEFYQSVIHSAARLTYTQVAAILDGESVEPELDLVIPHLKSLEKLYDLLLAKREQRGAIDFETVETRIIFGEREKIDRIVPVVRNRAHRIIEECMLAANVCAAEFLLKHKVPVLYRNHEGPTAEKLNDLRKILALLGLSLGGGDEPHARDYNKLLKQIRSRPDFEMLQTTLLRSLSQASYEAENQGHFGLAYTAYTHFTSPIRRYPDLLVHRAIKSIVYGQDYPYKKTDMAQLSEHCSFAERRADEATRDVMDWLKCEYMLDKIGDEFDAIITTVTNFGFFAELDDIHIEGLVHIASLKGDYYVFDKDKQQMTGKRTGNCYRLGDKIRIRVAAVSLDERKIDLLLSSDTGNFRRRKKHRESPKESGPGKTAAITAENTGNSDAQAVKKKKRSRRRARKMDLKRRL